MPVADGREGACVRRVRKQEFRHGRAKRGRCARSFMQRRLAVRVHGTGIRSSAQQRSYDGRMSLPCRTVQWLQFFLKKIPRPRRATRRLRERASQRNRYFPRKMRCAPSRALRVCADPPPLLAVAAPPQAPPAQHALRNAANRQDENPTEKKRLSSSARTLIIADAHEIRLLQRARARIRTSAVYPNVSAAPTSVPASSILLPHARARALSSALNPLNPLKSSAEERARKREGRRTAARAPCRRALLRRGARARPPIRTGSARRRPRPRAHAHARACLAHTAKSAEVEGLSDEEKGKKEEEEEEEEEGLNEEEKGKEEEEEGLSEDEKGKEEEEEEEDEEDEEEDEEEALSDEEKGKEEEEEEEEALSR